MHRSFLGFIKWEWVEGVKVPTYLRAPYSQVEPKAISVSSIHMTPDFTPYAQLAGWFEDDNVEFIVKVYHRLVDKFGEDCIELAHVNIDVTHTVVPMDSGDILEERRKVAMNKLRPDEYKVLGIEQLGVYHKLKYHKDDVDGRG